MRKTLVVIITFLGGLYYFFEFIMPEETMFLGRHLTDWQAEFGQAVLVVGVCAIFLGVTNLLRAHFTRVFRGRPGWVYSVATIVATFAMFGAVVWNYFEEEAGIKVGFGEHLNEILFQDLRVPLDATVFSLLAFYIASAAYRAFRLRSTEATLMMIVAFFVMIGQIPWTAGPIPFLADFRAWFMDIWNSAAQRGIFIGVMVGTLAMSLRIWLSLERGSFFDEEF